MVHPPSLNQAGLAWFKACSNSLPPWGSPNGRDVWKILLMSPTPALLYNADDVISAIGNAYCRTRWRAQQQNVEYTVYHNTECTLCHFLFNSFIDFLLTWFDGLFFSETPLAWALAWSWSNVDYCPAFVWLRRIKWMWKMNEWVLVWS